jgi:hypothetical protein
LPTLSEFTGLEEWTVSSNQLAGVSKCALVRVAIQRIRCGTCGREIDTLQRQSLAQARRQAWQFFKQVAEFSKFKLGLSNRRTALLAAFAFGRAVSATFVNDVTHVVGQKAQSTLARIANCRQKVAQF